MKITKQFGPKLSSVLLAFSLILLTGLFSRGAALHEVLKATLDSNISRAFDFEILYTNYGFTPNFLEVPLGSRVAFRNTVGVPLWTASDPHPTHTDYPEFDAKKDFASGQVYIFTFQKTGTFGYHNHEKSIDRGVIRVVDPAHPVLDVDKTVEGQRAVRDKLLAMFDPKDPNSIFKVVDAIQADPVLSLNCHDIAHDLGHRAYELYGFSEAMTFNNPHHVKHALVQYICAGGYMHGILEELSLHEPDFKTKPDIICDMVQEEDRASCFHGIGHVFMLADQRDASTSIADCRKVEQTADMYRCFEGVRMEQFWGNTAHVGTSTLGWDLEKPLAPCIDIAEDEKPTCFLYSTFGYLRTHVKDYPGSVRMCTESGLKESDAKFCLKGLGITMMSKFKGQHLERSEVYVEGLSIEEKHAFYQGVMGYARLSGVGDGELKNTCNLFKTDTEVCDAALLDSK